MASKGGKLIFITGPMNGGKTTELLLRLRRYEVADKAVVLVRPRTDTRAPDDTVQSKSGGSREAIVADTFDEAWEKIWPKQERMVIGIDEVQFFGEQTLADSVMKLVWQGHIIIVAGLVQKYNMHSRYCLDTWPSAVALYAQAHEVVKMNAICMKCKDENGVYSYHRGYFPNCPDLQGAVEVGDSEIYSSLCVVCYASEMSRSLVMFAKSK